MRNAVKAIQTRPQEGAIKTDHWGLPHGSARAVREVVAHDENDPGVHRINLNELRTVADVAFPTHHTACGHGWRTVIVPVTARSDRATDRLTGTTRNANTEEEPPA